MNTNNYIIRYLIVSVLLCLATTLDPHNSSGQPAQGGKNPSELDAYFESARQKWNIPGMAIAIVKDGKIIFKKGYGVRSLESNEPVDELTLFNIASLTKAFTAASLATLVDSQLISWDDNVIQYLPDFKLYDDYITKEITIRDLLCHRAGYKEFSGDLLWYETKYSRDEVIKRLQYLKPEYSFRHHYGYSNLMYLVAGSIIEKITGESWNSYIKRRFLEPLNMKLSNTTVNDLKQNTNIAYPHVVHNGELVPMHFINWDNIAPAGCLNSNVVELAEWMKLWLNGGTLNGKTFFSKAACWEMWSPQTIIPLSLPSQQVWPSMHFKAYGLGWELFDYHGYKIVDHSGGIDGMVSKIVLLPEENFGFVIVTNSSSFLPSALTYQILDYYLSVDEIDWSTMFYGFFQNYTSMTQEAHTALINSHRNSNVVPLKQTDYTGKFHSQLYGNSMVTNENGHLVITFEPSPSLIGDLTYLSGNSFLVELRKSPYLPSGIVEFIRNETNQIEMKVNIPNPDYDFGELDFVKQE